MNLTFDQPGMLWLGLLAVPLAVVGWMSLASLDRVPRCLVLLARTLLLLTIAVMLAAPNTVREHDDLTVIGLLDISGSVQRFARFPGDEAERVSYLEHLTRWFREATRTRTPHDRFGLVIFDGEAVAVVAPTSADYDDDHLDIRARIQPGTSIDDAISLGLAMFPADTARRLVLVTDGNETIGDAREAARQAAGRASAGLDGDRLSAVPIDVLPIAYEIAGDAQILRVEAPPAAQPGQTISLRIIMEATRPTRGRLLLRCEDTPIDLNGAEPGRARAVTLPAGQSVHVVPVPLGDTPVSRFEAVFEADAAYEDVLPDNNRAEAFTVSPSPGRILILDGHRSSPRNALAQMLEPAQLPVLVQRPEALPVDLLSFQNYDLLVLDNVPAYDLTSTQHELIGRYVNELGGGLIMIGGDQSFGAGGYNGTAVADVLPLLLDPPKALKVSPAALVLVIDTSGSMNQHVAGARATQQVVANAAAAQAIRSLYAESLIGVVTFTTTAHEYVPLQRNDNPTAIAQRVLGITAGGGTNLEPALRLADRMLREAEADRKHVVCLSDGRSPTRNLEAVVRGMRSEGIKLTAIGIGDAADHATLRKLAEIGEGEFYPVFNPTALPRVLVDSVQVINQPLIKDVPFVPVVRPTGSTLTVGMDQSPILGGLVVTSPRDDPRATVEMIHPDGEPLLAQWQVGLGRVVAFTSDVGGRWSSRWIDWPEAAAFWTQLVRTTRRPSVSHEAELTASLRDGRLYLTLDAATEEEGFLDYLQVDGTVYPPLGPPQRVRLPQTGPGRYEESLPARAAGNYIVALNPRRGSRQLAPVLGGASQATGTEFRRYESNLALLDDVADMTGGRRLDPEKPASIDLFDRSGLPVTVSLRPGWWPLVWLAIGLLLLDVTGRRLAWTTTAAARQLARALGRVTPAHVRGREAAATLATLRQVATDRAVERGASATGEGQVEQAQPPPAEPGPELETGETPAPAAATPEPGRIQAALRSLLRRSATTADDETPEETPPPTPEEPGDEAEGEEVSETTSTLLAAKRRARARIDRGGH